MAANRCGKKAKTAKEALEEILEQSNEFLKKTSKPKKKSHFFIFRDPLTGKRSSKHRLTVVCETKWDETKWKWKSVVCKMRICSLRNGNL